MRWHSTVRKRLLQQEEAYHENTSQFSPTVRCKGYVKEEVLQTGESTIETVAHVASRIQ